MSTSILNQKTPDPIPEFNDTLQVPARLAGGITLEPVFIQWLGATVIRVQAPGELLHLELHEARDLAAALQNLAAHIDEEAGR